MQERAPAVLASWCGLERHFGLAVTVEVVHHELGVVRSGANVRPQVNTPEALASQRVSVNQDVVSVAGYGIVTRG